MHFAEQALDLTGKRGLLAELLPICDESRQRANVLLLEWEERLTEVERQFAEEGIATELYTEELKAVDGLLGSDDIAPKDKLDVTDKVSHSIKSRLSSWIGRGIKKVGEFFRVQVNPDEVVDIKKEKITACFDVIDEAISIIRLFVCKQRTS